MTKPLLKRTVILFAVLVNIWAKPIVAQSKRIAEISAGGNAKLKVQPDIVTFTFSIDKIDTTEKNALKALNEESNLFSSMLEKLGIPHKAISVSDYRISGSEMDEDKPRKYTASNVLKVEFIINNKLIDAIYNEVQENNFKDLDISYETSLSDTLEKKTRLKLVQLAISDAKANALNISHSLGLTINKIKQVYKQNDGVIVYANEISMVRFTPPKIVRDTNIGYNSSFDRFQVEAIELEETITVIYEVLN